MTMAESFSSPPPASGDVGVLRGGQVVYSVIRFDLDLVIVVALRTQTFRDGSERTDEVELSPSAWQDLMDHGAVVQRQAVQEAR